MAERPEGVLTDLAHLPPVGTPERGEWDVTLREVNELYPDWSVINIGKARLRRETFERDYQGYYQGEEGRLGSVAGPNSSGSEGSWAEVGRADRAATNSG
jgi:hypothetical protein